MRGVPSFKDIQNMTDLEVIKVMIPQLACPCCHRNSGLNIVEVGTLGENKKQGLRKVGAVIHCPTCGLLNRKMEVFVPTTMAAYVAIFAQGKATNYATTRLAAYRPPPSKLKTGRSILKKYGLDGFVTEGRN